MRGWRLVLRITTVALCSLLSLLLLLAGATWFALSVDWKLPATAALTGPTVVRARDGTVLARFTSEVDRRVVALADVSDAVIDAVLASEDARFYEHRGVDPAALVRAVWTNVRTGGVRQGGSTLTQQYVKNAFTGGERSLFRKIREAVLSIQLEREHSKDEILERYLNEVYFGDGAYGIEAAARRFFGRSARDLGPAEAATLAQALPAPTVRNARTDPEGARARRDALLERMRQLGWLSDRQAEIAVATTLRVAPDRPDRWRVPHVVAHVREQLVATYGEETVLTGGLQVTTTVDLDAQAALEAAVAANLPSDTEQPVEAGAVAIDPATGDVLAMYGGPDFYDPVLPYAQVNLATDGIRQAGSTFKPFVFIAALEQGMGPDTRYLAPATVQIGPDWSPSNADRADHGELTLHDALVDSVNTVYAQVGVDVGADAIVDVVSRTGVRNDIPPDITVSLGAAAIGPSVLDLTSAFATIANDGVACPARTIATVQGPDGRILPPPTDRVPDVGVLADRPESLGARDTDVCYEAVDAAIARTTTQALEDAVARGTGTRAQLGIPQAGKTGTTDDSADAWFAGYTPDLALAVWIGDPTQTRPLGGVGDFARVFGGTIPALIWHDAAASLLADVAPRDFPDPGPLPGRMRTPGPPQPSPSPPPSPSPSPSASPSPSRSPRPSPRPTLSPRDEPTVDEPSSEPSPDEPSPSQEPSPTEASPTPSPSDTKSPDDEPSGPCIPPLITDGCRGG